MVFILCFRGQREDKYEILQQNSLFYSGPVPTRGSIAARQDTRKEARACRYRCVKPLALEGPYPCYLTVLRGSCCQVGVVLTSRRGEEEAGGAILSVGHCVCFGSLQIMRRGCWMLGWALGATCLFVSLSADAPHAEAAVVSPPPGGPLQDARRPAPRGPRGVGESREGLHWSHGRIRGPGSRRSSPGSSSQSGRDSIGRRRWEERPEYYRGGGWGDRGSDRWISNRGRGDRGGKYEKRRRFENGPPYRTRPGHSTDMRERYSPRGPPRHHWGHHWRERRPLGDRGNEGGQRGLVHREGRPSSGIEPSIDEVDGGQIGMGDVEEDPASV